MNFVRRVIDRQNVHKRVVHGDAFKCTRKDQDPELPPNKRGLSIHLMDAALKADNAKQYWEDAPELSLPSVFRPAVVRLAASAIREIMGGDPWPDTEVEDERDAKYAHLHHLMTCPCGGDDPNLNQRRRLAASCKKDSVLWPHLHPSKEKGVTPSDFPLPDDFSGPESWNTEFEL